MEINSNGCFPGRHPSVDRISKKNTNDAFGVSTSYVAFFLKTWGANLLKSFVCCVERDLKILDVQ